jgi:hypothetical protein
MRGEERVRQHPRMSAPKMGEYLDAGAPRRERILQDQKFPPTVQTVPYRDATDVCQRAVLRGGDVASSLLGAANALRGKPCTTQFEATSLACSLAGIEKFAALFPKLGLNGVTGTYAGPRGLAQSIQGVGISAYPLAVLRHEARGQERTGALLLVFRKEKPLTKKAGTAAADLLRGAVAQSGLVHRLTVKPELCIVVDVFHGAVHHAPRSRARLSNEIESACREIAIRWPTLGRRAA